MQKYLSTLLAMMAVITFSGNAQDTHTQKVPEVVPGKSSTTSTTTSSDSIVTEVVPEQSTTVTNIAPGGPVTTRAVTEIAPAAPLTTVKGSTTTTTNPGEVIAGNTQTTQTQIHRLDPVVARRHLSVTPQTVTITPEQRTALDRTVIIESQTAPVRRFYNVERNVVIVEEQGQSRELPYLTVPVLFVVDTADLLDVESRMALEQTASVINEITNTEPNALFDVEGHTSTEGSAEHNMRLSAERSTRIYNELTQRYGVAVSSLTAHGYGQNFALYPQGTERERQEDRRVLVVRTR